MLLSLYSTSATTPFFIGSDGAMCPKSTFNRIGTLKLLKTSITAFLSVIPSISWFIHSGLPDKNPLTLVNQPALFSCSKALLIPSGERSKDYSFFMILGIFFHFIIWCST